MTEQKSVEERFATFIEQEEYLLKLSECGVKSNRRFILDFSELYTFDEDLAIQLLGDPDGVFKILSDVFTSKLRTYAPEFVSGMTSINKNFYVSVRNLPVETSLSNVVGDQIGTMMQIDGIVTKASDAHPRCTYAVFKCAACNTGERMSIPQDDPIYMKKPQTPCGNCKKTKWELDKKKSRFIPEQWLTIQEKPEELPPGNIPKQFRVQVLDDLVNTINPGDRMKLVGIMDAVQEKSNSLSFTPFFRTINMERAIKDNTVLSLTTEDIEMIKELSQDPWIELKLQKSICPSLYGLENIKQAILYLLFGGVVKELEDVRVRGDIHVLLVGDPGTGKSQLLVFTQSVAPRGILTTGRLSTAVGLTAAVVKEKDGGFALEAGAMVLADKGVCCIDELDKMREEDRGAIHPAMEQQVVPVAKGGIIATLNSRTALLAAANPTLGRYNSYQTITQNINLPVTLLSRFDLIFVIKDIPNLEVDAEIAMHILKNYQKGTSKPEIAPVNVRKYINYAKTITPKLTDEVIDRARNFYVKMRGASIEGGEGAAIAITARQLESVIRLSEARARIFLRDEITVEDMEAAINLMTKSLEQVGIDMATGQIDIDILYTGKPKSLRDQLQRLLNTLSEMQQVSGSVRDDDLYEALQKGHGISMTEAGRLVGVLMRDGTIYSPRPGYYKRT